MVQLQNLGCDVLYTVEQHMLTHMKRLCPRNAIHSAISTVMQFFLYTCIGCRECIVDYKFTRICIAEFLNGYQMQIFCFKFMYQRMHLSKMYSSTVEPPSVRVGHLEYFLEKLGP